MHTEILTHQSLLELLDYSTISGVFVWKKRTKEQFRTGRGCKSWNTRLAGKEAGGFSVYGYILIGIYGRLYLAHRLAWLHTYGEWPSETIDHINRNKADNRIQNLRDVTHQVNCQNMPMQNRNTSGATGVYWDKHKNKWVVNIKVDGKTKHGGYFKNKDDAISRRKELDAEHGYHKNHGNSIA